MFVLKITTFVFFHDHQNWTCIRFLRRVSQYPTVVTDIYRFHYRILIAIGERLETKWINDRTHDSHYTVLLQFDQIWGQSLRQNKNLDSSCDLKVILKLWNLEQLVRQRVTAPVNSAALLFDFARCNNSHSVYWYSVSSPLFACFPWCCQRS